MVSSAVAVPDPAPEVPTDQPTSPTLKRRQSSSASSPADSNKRPRLETSNTNGSIDHVSPPPSATAMSPPRRKSTLTSTGAAEEKKRGQRLFGGLLSTLSQTSNKSSSNKRRTEIEQRQRDRLKHDMQERAEERRLKREELDRVRRTEQKRWQEESERLRHRNMRDMAGFLRTKTEPRLYYKPWELRKEEEEVIEKQKTQVEETIKSEIEQRQVRPRTANGADEDKSHTGASNGTNETAQEQQPTPPEQVAMELDDQQGNGDVSASTPPQEAETVPPEIVAEEAPAEGKGASDGGGDDKDHTVGTDEKQVDDDQGGDDHEQGHDEDQVIY